MAISKIEFLKQEGLINKNSDRIIHSEFTDEAIPFFDPYDLPQVKYEFLRNVRIVGESVTSVCKKFGFSREYFYKLERLFMERGYVALLNSPLGRRPILSLNQEIILYIVNKKNDNPKISGEQLRKEIMNYYKVECSRRTVERLIKQLNLDKKGL